ncbi:MAG: hypothetical protein K8S54_00430 [Spirochaetia bacterium]|nr:hypothetical protein [Spirochaetia bacterium]
MRRALPILCLDSSAGLLAGTFVLVFATWLGGLYGWPEEHMRFIGFVNLVYGCYSGCLALSLWKRKHIKTWPIRLLIAANIGWGIACLGQMCVVRSASAFGLAHLIVEGAFVAALALLEWRFVLPLTIENKLNHDHKRQNQDGLTPIR